MLVLTLEFNNKLLQLIFNKSIVSAHNGGPLGGFINSVKIAKKFVSNFFANVSSFLKCQILKYFIEKDENIILVGLVELNKIFLQHYHL